MKIDIKIKKLNEIFASGRKGFDFDGTLTQKKIQDKVKSLLAEGIEIYVISARSNSYQILDLTNKLGVKRYNVFAVGSNEEKVKKVLSLNLDKFYDNNQDVINKLPGIGVKV